jgi:hypothetical protein
VAFFVIWAAVLAPGVITLAKGRVALFFVGLLIGIVWLVACFRLATPNSPWARRFYDEEKLLRSKMRYPSVDPAEPSRVVLVTSVVFGLLVAAFTVSVVVGAAAD